MEFSILLGKVLIDTKISLLRREEKCVSRKGPRWRLRRVNEGRDHSFLGQLAGAENEHHRPNLFDLRCTK